VDAQECEQGPLKTERAPVHPCSVFRLSAAAFRAAANISSLVGGDIAGRTGDVKACFATGSCDNKAGGDLFRPV